VSSIKTYCYCIFPQASAADELRVTVASLREDAQQAADRYAKLLKSFQDHEENNRHSIEKVSKCGSGQHQKLSHGRRMF